MNALPVRRSFVSPLVLLGALLCVLVVLAGGRATADDALALGDPPLDGLVHLVVLHTNDVHGQVLPRPGTWLSREDPPLVGGIARLAGYVQRVRREHSGPLRGVLLVDAGDWYQGTPEGLVDRGLPFVRGLSAIGYDALALGNHEFDHGLANARRLVTEGVPNAVCANLHERTPEGGIGAPVDWIAPARVVAVAGLRVALVGFVTPETPEISHIDTRTELAFVDPVVALERALATLRAADEPFDLVVAVGHIDVESCRRLARAHPDLPLVVSGHEHRFLGEGEREGRTLIVQAGAKASVCGRVDLYLDPRTKSVVESRARLVDLLDEVAAEDRNPTVEAVAAELVELSEQRMAAVVGQLTAPLGRRRDLATSVAGAFLADCMRERTAADIGLMNRGGVRTDIAAGPVTRRQLFEIAPFDNHVVALTISGAELWELFEQAFDGSHSGLDPSGCRFFLAPRADGPPELVRVEIAGQPLDPERSYRVATNSFLAEGGDGYTQLVAGRDRVADPILLRDLLEEVFVREGIVTPPSDERWTAVGQ